jgi:hypothetical protein
VAISHANAEKRLTLEITGRAFNADRFKISMKATQLALRSNELLDFVRPHHSSLPQPSRLIISSGISNAVWRLISDYHQPSMLARAQSIQDKLAVSYCRASQDSRELIQTFEPNYSTGI